MCGSGGGSPEVGEKAPAMAMVQAGEIVGRILIIFRRWSHQSEWTGCGGERGEWRMPPSVWPEHQVNSEGIESAPGRQFARRR